MEASNEFDTESPTVTRTAESMTAIMVGMSVALKLATVEGTGVALAYAALIASER